MIEEDARPNWLDSLLRGAPAPKPPALESDRIKGLAKRGLLMPGLVTRAELQELSASVISHLVAQKS